LKWLFHHGPRLVFIAVGILIAYHLARLFSRRLVRVMARGGTGKRGSHQDRENRAQTLVGVFSNTVSLLILGGGSLMILDEVGIPIVQLKGGAAVLGLAVAFGAQNLIKDYFSGFMVLLEDQYGINDVVKIGDVSGQVEHISLRITVLRDLEGVVHFIPHGTITTISNLTHGWSRALFDIVFLKTVPLGQWAVKRELLRRIKKRFDELDIEIPFAHRTVIHRTKTRRLPCPRRRVRGRSPQREGRGPAPLFRS
jgi:small conductance mechanosensitive channel